MSLLRRSLVATGVAAAVVGAGFVMLPANADPPQPLPTAAIALGDSFISGEGAVDYEPVPDIGGTLYGDPGWAADNRISYFCHRSRNASIHQADLPGIDARFNLACSGAQPQDFTNPSSDRQPKGRWVKPQLEQLRDVAKTHDIDVVLVGLGSNTSHYSFGGAAEVCAGQFLADAWIGSWEFWVDLGTPGLDPKEGPCDPDDLATARQIAAGQRETINALRAMVKTLREVDADGEHRIVLQDYANPLPMDFHPTFHEAADRTDTREKFRELAKRRWAAGCPAHRQSLLTGHWFSETLGRVVRTSYSTLHAEFPDTDLVYLNVQHAFLGARLCENPDSPTNTLVRPMRGMRSPHGDFEKDMWHWNKGDLKRLRETCRDYFQTCQESWHPDKEGHGVLGTCLSRAAQTDKLFVECDRQPTRSVISGGLIHTYTCDRGVEQPRRADHPAVLYDTVWRCVRDS